MLETFNCGEKIQFIFGIKSNLESELKVGCDTSEGLLQIARTKADVFLSNCLKIGARSGAFDAAICIAVIHHLATEARRKEALVEIARVLKPGGKGLVYVWAKEQEIENLKSHYLRNKEKKKGKVEIGGEKNLPEVFAECEISGNEEGSLKLPVHASRTNFKHGDLFVPLTLKKPGTRKEASETGDENVDDKVHHRFYHVFCRGELESMARTIECIVVEEVYYEQGNWCLVFSAK